MENIEQRVKKIIAEQLGVNEAEIKNESSFVDDLGADSLDTVELVMALEEEFETEIPGRGSREDHHRAAGHRLRQVARQGLSASPSQCSAAESSSPGWASSARSATPSRRPGQNVLAGKSGITRVTRFDPSRLSCQIAGEVKDFDVTQYLSPKEARRMDRFIHFGMAAGCRPGRIRATR